MKPNSIRRILIPTDFSETGLLAVKHASFMAKLSKADLYLLHAIELPATAFDIYSSSAVMENNSPIEANVSKKLTDLATDVKKEYCINVKTICTAGSPAREIARMVKEEKIDLVVMGTHGVSGFNEFFAGSNAHKTVSACPCPVITVQTNAEHLVFRRIVLPIDDSFDSRQKVNFTAKLAKMYAAKIYILGLLNDKEDVDENKFRVKLHSVEKFLIVSEVLFETKVVRSDNFAQTTLKFSAKINADLISVLTGHESNLKGIFLGAFAKQIVNHSKIPVLSMRPAELGVYDSVSLAGSNSN